MALRFPTSSELGGDLVSMVLAELQLCRLNRREKMVLFTDTRTNPNYTAAFLAAGKELAGCIFELKIPFLSGHDGRAMNLAPIVEILKDGNLVIDLSTGTVLFLYSRGLAEVLQSGARVLQVKAEEDQLLRCFPAEDVQRRTQKGAEWLERARELRVISKAGTELTMSKTGRPAITQIGISHVSGRWDSWPSGFLYCAPQEETANGTLVLDVGDILVMLGRYVQEPVRLTVKGGRITQVDGGVDAVLLQERLGHWKDPEAYIISHIGWGTDHRARWTEVAQRGTEDGARDVRSTYGNVQIAFGANFRLGGKNQTSAHEDLVLRRASLELDGIVVVEDGSILPEELR